MARQQRVKRPRAASAAVAAKVAATTAAKNATEPTARYKVEAVSRAMLVLETLRRGPAPLAAAALAARTGIPIAAVEATLATLGRRGLVQHAGDTQLCSLGWLRLADVKRQQLDVREVALPVMRRLRDGVNETASLSIRIGASRVNIEYAECYHEVRRIVQPGSHVALHVGAGGRALMSGLDDAEIEAYLAPIPLSQLHKSQLIDDIRATRRDGHAIVEGEIANDTAAISAPVLNHVGEVVAALSVSLPHERLDTGVRARCIKEVTNGDREVSLALGCPGGRE